MRALATIQFSAIKKDPYPGADEGDCSLEFINTDGSAVILRTHWGVESFYFHEIIQNCCKVRLTLPSGVFIGALKAMHDFAPTGLQVSIEGQWSGKQAGLIGGISSLGQFKAYDITVLEGTYVLPEEEEGLPYTLYKERCNKHRLLHGEKTIRAEHQLYIEDPQIDTIWANWRESLRRTLDTPMSVFTAKQQLISAQRRLKDLAATPYFEGIQLVEVMMQLSGVQCWTRSKHFSETGEYTQAYLTALVDGQVEEVLITKEEYDLLEDAAKRSFNWHVSQQIDLWKGTDWDLPVPCDDSAYLYDYEGNDED